MHINGILLGSVSELQQLCPLAERLRSPELVILDEARIPFVIHGLHSSSNSFLVRILKGNTTQIKILGSLS